MIAAVDAGVELVPDPSRTIVRLFLPGASTPGEGSRTEGVLARVLATPPADLAAEARDILLRFGDRHVRLTSLLRENAAVVRPAGAPALSDDLAVVVGAVFAAEFSVEGAALCNPSAVIHPDQNGLEPGEQRVLVSMRSIGEPHLSSIQFCEAIIRADATWEFLSREGPLEVATITPGSWARDHFLRALEHEGRTDEVVRFIGQALGAEFDSGAVEVAVRALPAPALAHPDAHAQLDGVRVVAASAYDATFSGTSRLSARVLLPAAEEERHGIEDARFLLFEDDDGQESYQATYTAFDGRSIASRLLTTRDFRSFRVQRLTGPPSRSKGMALFPRRIEGTYFSLSRGDGESVCVTRSTDGLHWGEETPLRREIRMWEIVQSGNCGAPIELPEGWLVLTHGVGPFREYSIGALLLDLDDPSHVIAASPLPLVTAVGSERAGYVPNVVYSCGGLVHDGVLWIPYGVGDCRIRVASIALDALLASMTATA